MINQTINIIIIRMIIIIIQQIQSLFIPTITKMVLERCNRIASNPCSGADVRCCHCPFFDCGNVAIGSAFDGDDFIVTIIIVGGSVLVGRSLELRRGRFVFRVCVHDGVVVTVVVVAAVMDC